MTENRKTSVIITCHNYGSFLEESIVSVLQQTLLAKEVVVINDASSDNSENIALNFGNKIKYFFVDFKNAQKARNFGLAKSTGEYVVFLDADDYFHDDFLEKMQQKMETNPDLAMVYCDRENIGDPNILKELGLNTSWEACDFDYNLLTRGNYISLPSLIRRDKFNGFDEDINRFQDWEAWLTLLKNSRAERIPEKLFSVRFHSSNKTLKVDGDIERIKILAKHKFFNVLNDDFKQLKSLKETMCEMVKTKKWEIKQKDEIIRKLNEEIDQKELVITLIVNSLRWKIPNYFYKLYINNIKKFIPHSIFIFKNKIVDFFIRIVRILRTNKASLVLKKYFYLFKLAIIEFKINGIEGLKFSIKRHLSKRKGVLFLPYAIVNDHINNLVTIGILTKDRLDLIAPCIESIESNTSKKYSVEILIGDTGSNDKGTWEFYKNIQKKYKNIHVIKFKSYFFSKNYNDLFRMGANGQYLILLNNDTIVKDDWMDNLVDPLKDKRVGIVGGKLLYRDETIQHAGVEFDKNGNGIHVFSRKNKNDENISFKAVVPSVTFACVAVRHDVYDRFKLREEFKEEAQDTDFCFRLSNAGFDVLYNPDVEIYHLENSTRDWRKGESDRILFRQIWNEKIAMFVNSENNQRRKFDENKYGGAIVVIRDDGIGDLLMGVSAFRNLRNKYPEKTLLLATYERNTEMMYGFGIFDEIISIPNGKKYTPIPIPTKNTTVYNLIDLEMKFGNMHAKSKDENKQPRQISFARALDVSTEYQFVSMPNFPRAKKAVSDILRLAGITKNDKIVVFNLLSTNPARSWWYPYYPELIRAIEERGFTPLIVGTSDNKYLRGNKVVNIVGKTKTIAEYIEAIKIGEYVISTDTSACHIAALAGIPFLAIFTGGVLPEARLNFYSKYEVAEPSRGLQCYPCWDEGCKDPALYWKKEPCRIMVKPENVIKKFDKLISSYTKN